MYSHKIVVFNPFIPTEQNGANRGASGNKSNGLKPNYFAHYGAKTQQQPQQQQQQQPYGFHVNELFNVSNLTNCSTMG